MSRAAAFLCVFVQVRSQNFPFPMHLIPKGTADVFGAKCLDGSVPGFYWKPAQNPASKNKWKIHLRGGGWCFSPADCASRTNNEGGSSKYFYPSAYDMNDEAVYGLMNDNSSNPFGDWNAVWSPYCDGSSWTGDRDDPVQFNSSLTLWFRGFRNLNAMLFELNVLGNFIDEAAEVIVTGTSAGGLATALHSSFIKSQVPMSARLVALPDAGWWADVVDVHGDHTFAAGFIKAYGPQLWNATARALPAPCLSAYPPAEAWKCMLTESAYTTALAHVDGVFVMQSLYDSAQLSMELNLGCDPFTSCNASQLATMQNYRASIQSRVETEQAEFGGRDGHFFTACYQHEESCRDFDWFGIQVGSQGLTANETFYNWYYGTGGPTRVADGLWPDNKSCQPQGVRHGSC